MPIDPSIALGFQLPMATQSQGDSQDMLSRLITLRALMQKLGRGGQSLGGMMTGRMTTEPNVTPTPPAAQTPGTTVTPPAAPAPPAPPAPQPVTGSTFMHGLTRLGDSVYSLDGGKTWVNSSTGQPAAGDVYYQTAIGTIGGQ